MSRGSPALKREVLSLAFIPEHDLLHPIASGAYGQVWLARNRLGVHRAVKLVHRAGFDHDRPFEKEKALDELEKHFDESQVWHQINFKATYDPLHNDPRFKALVKRAGLQ